MIVFTPHVFGETIYDEIDEIKEFETPEEMKEYLSNFWSIDNNITINDIEIGEQLEYKDKRLGLEDIRYVYLKINGKSRRIGYCTTKYKNLEEIINRIKSEKQESSLKDKFLKIRKLVPNKKRNNN